MKNRITKLIVRLNLAPIIALTACSTGIEDVSTVTTQQPYFVTAQDISVEENSNNVATILAADPDSPTDFSFTVSGGDDRNSFSLTDKTLTFLAAPDYEAPKDLNQDNIYEIELTATDRSGLSVSQLFKVNIVNLNDNAPVFLTSDGLIIDENITDVVTLAVTDLDQDIITFSITGGVDIAKFTLSGTDKNVLSFKDRPDFELPQNFNQNSPNIYEVEITAEDGDISHNISNLFQVQIKDINVQPPKVTVSAGIKQLIFNWPMDLEATHFKLLHDENGLSGFSQLGANIPASSTQISIDMAAHLKDWYNGLYLLTACNGNFCETSSTTNVVDKMRDVIGYIKAQNTQAGDNFGGAVALSGDANTLVVGARLTDNRNGTVSVYDLSQNGILIPPQVIIAKNALLGLFGTSIAISNDGKTLAVGSSSEDSNTKGILNDGSAPSYSCATNAEVNCLKESGAVYIYSLNLTNKWVQTAYIKQSTPLTKAYFGASVKLSADGGTLVVTHALGGQTPIATATREINIFANSGSGWSEEPPIKPTISMPRLGYSIAISGDGSVIALGGAVDIGAAVVYTRSATGWNATAVSASNAEAGDSFGFSVALNNNGNLLAVSSTGEDSAAIATSLDGTGESDNSAPNSGAVYLYSSGSGWQQQAYIKSPNTRAHDKFGTSLAFDGPGNLLAVGAIYENTRSSGGGDSALLNDDCASTKTNCAPDSGAVYLFKSGLGTTAWQKSTHIKAANPNAHDWFGRSLALSTDGKTLVVGAMLEDSNERGVVSAKNAINNKDAVNSGVVYLY